MVSFVIILFKADEDEPLLSPHTLFFLLYSALHHIVLPEALQEQSQHCTAVIAAVLNNVLNGGWK